MLIAQAAAFYRHLSLERGLSRNTCAAYAGDINRFLKDCDLRKTDPAGADSGFLEEYFWRLRSSARLKPSSVFRKMEAIKAFYRFMLIEGKVSEDPTCTFSSPRQPERVPRFMSGDDVTKLLSYPGGNTFAGIRTITAVELLYATGMRISELLELRPESVNPAQGWVRVYGKGGKERMIPLHARAARSLELYQKIRGERFGGRAADDELFVNRSGRKLSRVQIWKDIRALGDKAGLGKGLHPHLFRHTFASHLLRGGSDLRSLQEMLGHSSLNTTQIYTHVEKSDLKAAHRKYHRDK
ncbi:MAG: tyrosine recombinase [bacterium]